MSETTDTTASETAPEQTEQAAGTQAEQAPISQGEGGETQVTEQAGEKTDPEPKPEPKPKRTDRHIAHLTARAADEQRLREAAERRAEAAEALLRVNREGGDDTPPPPRQDGSQDVETRARQLIQEREFNRRLEEIDATGKKDLGDAWETAKATLTSLGAVNNQAFLQALAETEAPHKIFASLADDPDTLMELLQRSPVSMAARIARMDADLNRPAPPKPLSAAPIPATRVQTGAVIKDFDPYAIPSGMSMKAWNAEMDKLLPPSLGGKRKSA